MRSFVTLKMLAARRIKAGRELNPRLSYFCFQLPEAS